MRLGIVSACLVCAPWHLWRVFVGNISLKPRARHYLQEQADRYGNPKPPSQLSPGVLTLSRHSWPQHGNVLRPCVGGCQGPHTLVARYAWRAQPAPGNMQGSVYLDNPACHAVLSLPTYNNDTYKQREDTRAGHNLDQRPKQQPPRAKCLVHSSIPCVLWSAAH
jgi:hypothetical protein